MDGVSEFLTTAGESVSVFGYGSLMSYESATKSLKRVLSFKTAEVAGYARVFNKVCVHSVQTGAVNWATREVACCSAARMPGRVIVGALLELPRSDLSDFLEREHEFRIVPVEARVGATGEKVRALLCEEFDDESYRVKCSGEGEFERRVGQFYRGRIWRTDIRPARAYLQLCLAAARRLGPAASENLLDASYLGGKETTIAEYLGARPHVLGHTTAPARYQDTPPPSEQKPCE